jgi:hypothetical protein
MMRMGIALSRSTMGCPSGMAYPGTTGKWQLSKFVFEVVQFARGPSAFNLPIRQCRHTSGIIATIFQPFQGAKDITRDFCLSENTDDSTHNVLPM